MDLKRLARSKGTNLKQVAEKCGIPPTTLYAISRGDTNFDNVGISTAMKVANALGMTVEQLYTGEVNPPAEIKHDSEEHELIYLYRNMSPDMQKTLLETARNFAALKGVGKFDGERVAGMLVIG